MDRLQRFRRFLVETVIGRERHRDLKAWAARWFAVDETLFARAARNIAGQNGKIKVRIQIYPISGPAEYAGPIKRFVRRHHAYSVWKSQVVTVPNAVLAGRHLCVIADGRVLAGSAIGKKSIARTANLRRDRWRRFSAGPDATITSIDEKVVLVGGRSGAFFHWMTEIVPRLMIVAEDSRLREPPLLMRPAHSPFQQETLRALALNPRFVEEEFVKVPVVTFPTHMVIERPARLSPEIIAYADRFARDYLGADEQGGGRRIYVSRADAGRREIVNENALLRVLERNGFERVIPSELSLRDQAALFQSASAVVAPHGGALASLAFCRPGTKVFELFPESWVRFSPFWILASLAGLDYRLVLCKPASQKHPVIHSDMLVDPALLESLLKSV
jgi:capsular polysaccharide biosynthesis protein